MVQQPVTVALVGPAYVRTMAAYNAEMNRRIYAAAQRLSDAERRRSRGAFWVSIHGTQCHLLWGDCIWMSRFDGRPKPALGIKQSADLIADFDELARARFDADERISSWAGRVGEEWLIKRRRWLFAPGKPEA